MNVLRTQRVQSLQQESHRLEVDPKVGCSHIPAGQRSRLWVWIVCQYDPEVLSDPLLDKASS